MRQSRQEQVLRTVITLASITCDRCAKETLDLKQNNFAGGRVEARGFGYGSRHDLEVWEWDICDDCTEELVAWFSFADLEPEAV